MTAMPLALAASAEISHLPVAVRTEIDLLARVLKKALAARPKMEAYKAAAAEMTAAGYPRSASTMRALAGLYAKSGFDWRVLVDERKVPHDDTRMPRAFILDTKRRFEQHANSSRQAHVELIEDWRSGKPIPGYLVSPEPDPYTDIPPGWSYENLMKVCKSTPFEKTAMRIGLGKAKAEHGPKNFNSRRHLWFLSDVMFDDVGHDGFIHIDTHRQLCRVEQLGAYDVFSANYFEYGTKPQLKKFDPKTQAWMTDSLKESSMRLLLAKFLYLYGFSPRGTNLVVELGTATIRDATARILHDRIKAIHGKALITVDKASWTGKKQIVEGMFLGSGGGNPRHKAPLESWHHLLHTASGSLPAQTGPDVARRPEQLHGILKASETLLKIAPFLSPWAQSKLKYPTLEYHTEFLPILREIINRINRRTDHEIEGWAACGFLTHEYRFHRGSQEWLSQQKFLELPDVQRSMLAEAIKHDNALQRPRRLSPHEVFEMHRHEAIPAPIGMIAEILYADLAKPVACRRSYFELEDQEISPEVLRYESRIRTTDGHEHELAPDTYEVVINPFQPDDLWVYDAKGAFLGLARRDIPASRADASARGAKLARYNERFDDLAAPLKARHADLARKEMLRLKNNIEVVEGPQSEIEAQLLEDREERSAAEPTDETPDLSSL